MKLSENSILPDPADFGRKLRKVRTMMRITQKEMAAKIGITSAAYANWELGKRVPRLSRVKNVADVTGLPLTYFLDPKKDIDMDLDLDQQILESDAVVPLVNSALLSGTPDLAAIWKQARGYSAELLNKNELKDFFAFKVEDESMQVLSFDGRTIAKGSVAIIRKAESSLLEEGALAGVPALVSPNGLGAMIREIQWDVGSIILKPWNPEYRPRRYSRNEVRLFGQAVKSVLAY